MVRYKWFRIGWNGNVEELSSLLLSNPYSLERKCGFNAQEDQFVKGLRFIWESAVLAGALDIEGGIRQQTISSLSYLDFAIFSRKSGCYVRVTNPGRSLSSFWTEMERILGFGFWLESVDVVSKCIPHMREKFGVLSLVALKLTNVVVSPNVLGRLEFVSKGGIGDDGLAPYKSLPHVLEYSAYEVIYEGVRGQITFNRNGVVKVSDSIAPLVVEVIENML